MNLVFLLFRFYFFEVDFKFRLNLDKCWSFIWSSIEAFVHQLDNKIILSPNTSLSIKSQFIVIIVSDLTDDLVLCIPIIRDFIGKKFPEKNAKTVDIWEEVHLLFFHYLWGHPLIGANSSLIFLFWLFLSSRKSEIAQFNFPVFIQENVGTFEITMEYVFHVMKINHSFDNVINDLKNFLFRELFFLLVDLIKQTSVFKVFSDELILVGGNANPHVKNDIGVFETT